MFNAKHYVPILKWKRGEQKALEFLSAQQRKGLTPMIEILSPPWDHINDLYSKSIDEHLKNIGEQIQRSWPNNSPLFIDLSLLDDSLRMKDGKHPLEFILAEARNRDLKIIPVTGSYADSKFNQIVKNANLQDSFGICLRLEDEDFMDLADVIDTLLKELGTSPEDIDIILDLKYVSPPDIQRNLMVTLNLVNTIPYVQRWRTLTLCATAFPENLSGISSGQTISRAEWIIWDNIVRNKTKFKRIPTFGDYAIANPKIVELDPRIMQMSASIRYSAEKYWVIFRGRSVRRGWDQYHDLSKQVIQHPDYCGRSFSWGDQKIYECAHRQCGTGNAETWRRVATNHHLALVIEQLANFSGI